MHVGTRFMITYVSNSEESFGMSDEAHGALPYKFTLSELKYASHLSQM